MALGNFKSFMLKVRTQLSPHSMEEVQLITFIEGPKSYFSPLLRLLVENPSGITSFRKLLRAASIF